MTAEELQDLSDKLKTSDGYIYISYSDGKYDHYINSIMAYMSDEDIYTNNPSNVFRNYTSISELAIMANNDSDLLDVFIQALINLKQ